MASNRAITAVADRQSSLEMPTLREVGAETVQPCARPDRRRPEGRRCRLDASYSCSFQPSGNGSPASQRLLPPLHQIVPNLPCSDLMWPLVWPLNFCSSAQRRRVVLARAAASYPRVRTTVLTLLKHGPFKDSCMPSSLLPLHGSEGLARASFDRTKFKWAGAPGLMPLTDEA